MNRQLKTKQIYTLQRIKSGFNCWIACGFCFSVLVACENLAGPAVDPTPFNACKPVVQTLSCVDNALQDDPNLISPPAASSFIRGIFFELSAKILGDVGPALATNPDSVKTCETWPEVLNTAIEERENKPGNGLRLPELEEVFEATGCPMN